MLHRIRYWLRAVFRRSALDRELEEEMQLHIDRRVESLIAEGLRPAEARLAARREFGNPTAHRDAARDATQTDWVDSIRADVRFALRYFARKPLSAATIVLLLAFGIGGSSFQLAALRSLVSRPPEGISHDASLVRLRGMYRPKDAPRWRDRTLWYPEIQEISKIPNIFDAVAAWTTKDVVGSTRDGANETALWAQFVTTDFFKVIGAHVTQGPGFPDASADDAQPVAVISSALWEDMFDRTDITGKVIMLNGVAVRIVGVGPQDFTGALSFDSRRVLWLPLSSRATVLGLAGSNPLASLDSAEFQAVGRLRAGVSLERATAAARVVSGRVTPPIMSPAPTGANARFLMASDVVPLRGDTSLDSGLPLLFAAWGVLATLIMAVVCTNVSGLVLSASVSRRHEIAVRLSLGASRARVIRQLLTESILLAFGGAVLGFIVYLTILAGMSRIPEARYVRSDLTTFLLTMLVAVGTGILFGVTPAFHATRHGVGEVLKSGASGATRRSRLHQSFVVAQIFLVQPLLVLIASMIVSLTARDLVTLPSGIPDHVLQLSIGEIPGAKAEQIAARQRFVERLGEVPGVVRMIADPAQMGSVTLSVRDEDRGALARANDPTTVDVFMSVPGYFDLMGVPLLRGDDRVPGDTTSTAIISSDLARELWGDSDPIGKRFRPMSPTPAARRELVVTGVYDSRHLSSGTANAKVYRSVKDWGAFRYLIRTASPAAELAETVRRIAREELPRTAVEPPVTLAQIDEEKLAAARTGGLAISAVATLVLLLASIGLYGIVALSVGQRRREIGVRMALGARSGQVVGLFYRSGIGLAALGLVLGLPISLVATRLFPALAEQMGTHARAPNLWIIGPSVAAIVLIVASIATLIPATRAATVNPVTALRTD